MKENIVNLIDKSKTIMNTIDLTIDDDEIIEIKATNKSTSNNDEFLLLAITNRNYINAHKKSLLSNQVNLNKYYKALNHIIHFKDSKENQLKNFDTDSIQLLLELDIIIKNHKFQQHFLDSDDEFDDDDDNGDNNNNYIDDNDKSNKHNSNKDKSSSKSRCSCCRSTGHNKLSCPLNPKRKHNKILNGTKKNKKQKKKKTKIKSKISIKNEWPIIVQNECKIKTEIKTEK